MKLFIFKTNPDCKFIAGMECIKHTDAISAIEFLRNKLLNNKQINNVYYKDLEDKSKLEKSMLQYFYLDTILDLSPTFDSPCTVTSIFMDK